MPDPICRWRNTTVETLKQFLSYFPTEITDESEARSKINELFGADFFHTAAQLANQLGLFYFDDNKFYPQIKNKLLNDDKIKEYIKFWFKRYYVPNPYTKRGFENVSPKLLVNSIIEILNRNNGRYNLQTALSEAFDADTGNIDMIKNLFKNYSDDFEVINDEVLYSNNKRYMKPYLNDYKVSYDRNDKKSFFEYYGRSIVMRNHNRILFGAPGTGKSYILNKEAIDNFKPTNIERVTFYPTYSYANFVGTYKPVTKLNKCDIDLNDDEKDILYILKDKTLSAQEKYDALYEKFDKRGITRIPILLGLCCDDNFETKKIDGTSITDNSVEKNHGKALRPFVNLKNLNEKSSEIIYEYVPGPFLRVLTNAIKNPKEDYLLIIEELNRANVAAVFGDIFQLLDRTASGESQYEIAPSEDLIKYFLEQGINLSSLKIPKNFYLWSTMNSADQGVFPIDTAFKRRWNFEYIDIDNNQSEISEYKFLLPRSTNEISWNQIRKAINKKLLITCNVNEDKLMGPFFISESILKDKEKFIEAFKNKVIMYLYEDAAKQRHHRQEIFAGCDFTSNAISYSSICKKFDSIGLAIFGELNYESEEES